MQRWAKPIVESPKLPLEGRKECVLNWTFLVATRDLEERHFHFLFEILI